MYTVPITEGIVDCYQRFHVHNTFKYQSNRQEVRMASDVSTLSAAPTTFMECARRAGKASRMAYDAGVRLMEVEFPPLPLEYLEDSSSSARDIANANTRWAVEYAKSFADLGKVSIIFPDQEELDEALTYVERQGGIGSNENVTLATIRADSIKNAQTIDQIISSAFGARLGGVVQGVPDTIIYVAVVSSTQELPDIRKLHDLNPSIPIVLFNLKLDQLRGDLGLPLFPGRDFQYDFLSRFQPVFLMRSRAFTTSLRRPPFILNYSGLLFRAYPEKFQYILNTGGGKSKVVKTSDIRPSSADFRDALIAALEVPGIPKDELKTNAPSLWWENDVSKEKYSEWRK